MRPRAIPLAGSALSTPRISLVGVKTRVGLLDGCTGVVCAGWVPWRGIPGGVPGGCYTGYHTTLPVPGIAHPPVHWYCQGPTSGITGSWDVRRPLQGPPGPSAHPAPRAASGPASGPIRARFRYIYLKVSLEPGVSTLFVDEAWHTPCFKKPA